MKSIKDIIVNEDTSLRDALNTIDKSSKQICLVLDNSQKLLGTISDGDIRRALLNNISLDEIIINVYFKNPTVANVNDSKETILNLCKINKIHQIPIVDNDNNIVGLEILDELIVSESKVNKVILMVGGLGTRLRPLTENTPKPMLPVGGKPILQTIVEKFVSYGFVNIVMCIGYKSHIIQDFFEDGSRFGANIEYILENERMGTAGALSLLSQDQVTSEPFFIMNGDLLTNVNFEHFLNFHIQNNAKATMGVREYDFQVPYGVVNLEDGKIKSIIEKPIHNFFVSAGIYILNSECIDLIPKDEFYDMPTLFDTLIKMNENTISFPIREYWLDIGRMDEYEKANKEYHKVF
jgi:dTDP-glucose pyrophosphorylase/predicted transcriptional regulator